jgi:hypothetical protein
VGTQTPGDGRQPVGLPGIVVHITDEAPLDADPPAGPVPVAADRVLELGDRVGPVDRDELVAQLVGGGVEADRQRDREPDVGEPVDARHEPDRRDRDAPGREPEALRVVEPAHRRQGRRQVGQRLPHAHEDDVGHVVGRVGRQLVGGDAAAAQRRVAHHHLADHLAGGQLATEARLPGGAERAAHRATGLGRDAHRGPPRVQHQDGLDGLAVGVAQQQLVGVPVVGDPVGDELGPGRREPSGELRPQIRRQVGHLGRVVDTAHQPGVQLPGPVGRLVELGEQRRQPVAVERVRVHPRRLGRGRWTFAGHAELRDEGGQPTGPDGASRVRQGDDPAAGLRRPGAGPGQPLRRSSSTV